MFFFSLYAASSESFGVGDHGERDERFYRVYKQPTTRELFTKLHDSLAAHSSLSDRDRIVEIFQFPRKLSLMGDFVREATGNRQQRVVYRH
jgi:hypothetical protein